MIYFYNKRFNEAQKFVIFIIQKFATNQFSWNLWTALQKNCKIKEALSVIRRSVQLSLNDPKKHYSLGIILPKLEGFKEAEAIFTKAIALHIK